MNQDKKTEKIPGSLDELTEQPAGEKFTVREDFTIDKGKLIPRNGGKITYGLVKDSCDTDYTATLKWDAGRKEWIAETYHRFYEGWVNNELSYPEYYGGPYSLNEPAYRILMKAYNISEGVISMQAAVRMSPSELEIISLMNAKGSLMNATGDKNG